MPLISSCDETFLRGNFNAAAFSDTAKESSTGKRERGSAVKQNTTGGTAKRALADSEDH